MSGIIDRYLLREIFRTFVAVTAVLMLILLGDQFARGLARAAADRIPRDAVLKLMGLTSIEYLSLMLPAAFFFAVMLTLGRLYRDSEMAALNACGVGAGRLLRPLLWAAVLVASGLAVLSFDTVPWAARASIEIREEGQRQMQITALEPGRFRSASGGRLVFYARDRNPAGQLTGVFIQQRVDELVEIVTASRAEQRVSLEQNENYLVLYDGIRYTGQPGSPEFRTARFREHGIPLPIPGREDTAEQRRQMSTFALLGTGDAEDSAELHWRLAAPASLIVLTLLAVPLGRAPPRAGRYGRLGFALLVFVLYSNMMGIGRMLIEDGRVPTWLGLWWVHGTLLAVGLLMLYMQGGGAWRLRARRRSA
ncbi:MAG: LPS export ABC transporter permease LptF [Gammaproteobacteria bacterium]